MHSTPTSRHRLPRRERDSAGEGMGKPGTTYDFLKDGRLASVRIGDMIRIPMSEIERLKGEARRAAP